MLKDDWLQCSNPKGVEFALISYADDNLMSMLVRESTLEITSPAALVRG